MVALNNSRTTVTVPYTVHKEKCFVVRNRPHTTVILFSHRVLAVWSIESTERQVVSHPPGSRLVSWQMPWASLDLDWTVRGSAHPRAALALSLN
ncbi:hypothetical protein RRG08_001127 [Elysia crispata]|uniref:Uncharacterized protein n=1 Tax=Elysia crispata TaxID=231223 RepID=A0AAE1DRC0_9GAST|nr:hypothetical protein RRG08_001127 [Elysia crispata]